MIAPLKVHLLWTLVEETCILEGKHCSSLLALSCLCSYMYACEKCLEWLYIYPTQIDQIKLAVSEMKILKVMKIQKAFTLLLHHPPQDHHARNARWALLDDPYSVLFCDEAFFICLWSQLLQSYARHLNELQEDLKASRNERERLEQSLDAVRKDLRVAQNSDVAYAQIYHENERLKHEVKRLKKDSTLDPDSERAYYDRMFSYPSNASVHLVGSVPYKSISKLMLPLSIVFKSAHTFGSCGYWVSHSCKFYASC